MGYSGYSEYTWYSEYSWYTGYAAYSALCASGDDHEEDVSVKTSHLGFVYDHDGVV